MTKETGYEKIPHAVFNKNDNQVSRSYATKSDAEFELAAHKRNSIFNASFFYVKEVKNSTA